VPCKNSLGLVTVELRNAACSRSPTVLNLILMMLNSPLVGFRRQAALQAEIVALRHQLTVLQRTQKPKRLTLNRPDRWLLVVPILEVRCRGSMLWQSALRHGTIAKNPVVRAVPITSEGAIVGTVPRWRNNPRVRAIQRRQVQLRLSVRTFPNLSVDLEHLLDFDWNVTVAHISLFPDYCP
jgi:hypothetical protein